MDITSYLLGKNASGTAPTGEIEITQNGITNVSSYATANVNVGGGDSDYFESTISSGSIYKSGIADTIKKIPSSFTISGTSLENTFNRFDFKNNTMPNLINSNLITNWKNTFSITSFNGTTFDLSNITFGRNITTMQSAFSSCSVDKINLSNLGQVDTEINCQSMFSYSTAKEIDLSNFEVLGNSWNANYMFQRCANLEKIDVSKLDFTICTFSYMFEDTPTNCLILVKDQTQKDWFTTNFPSLTNVVIKGA